MWFIHSLGYIHQTKSLIFLWSSNYNLTTIHNPLQLNTTTRTNFASQLWKLSLTLSPFIQLSNQFRVRTCWPKNLDKIGPKFFFQGNASSPKEFMKYLQYFPDQSPQTNNLPLGDWLDSTLEKNLPLGDWSCSNSATTWGYHWMKAFSMY